jgi:hypothetical protein
VVEQCPFKAWVAGSNPAALTRISKHLADSGEVGFRHPWTPSENETLVSIPSGLPSGEEPALQNGVNSNEISYTSQ